MCGIAGIFDPTNTYGEAHLKLMTDALSHRGPDGEGIWKEEDASIFLGHRRLSIIDLTEAASQPLEYLDRYVIIHNGEIYNYKELREELQNFGYTFKSDSDTEIIPALWDKYGEAALERLDGMFAFALWDRLNKTLYLARDRFGEKPLYFIHDDFSQSFLFASEIKAFKEIGIRLEPDPTMVLHFLGTGAVSPTKDAVFYKNIQQVSAGSFIKLKLHNRVFSKHIYWKPPTIQSRVLDSDEVIHQMNTLFLQSIQMRMRSDVEVGTSLSGGLDSASIIAGIHQLKDLPDSYKHQSFTASFPGFEKDETAAVKEIAAQFHLNSHPIIPSELSFTNDIENFILHHEEPIQSASVYAQYHVYKTAKEAGVKVLLDGQGADELLGGYNKYDHWFLQDLWKQLQWGKWKKELAALQNNQPDLHWNFKNVMAAYFPTLAAWMLKRKTTERIHNNPWINQSYCNEYLNKEVLHKPIIHSFNDILSYNCFEVGLPELLRYADKNAMAHGVEVRLPFLQHTLATYMLHLPASLKIHDGYHKWILRKMMDGILPASIVWNRNKIGFEPPQKQWMDAPQIVEMIREAKNYLVSNNILNSKILDRPHQSHHAYDSNGLDWRILVTGTLLKSLQ